MAEVIEFQPTVYELRELTSKDIFPMVQILNKIGVREFKSVFASDEVKDAIAGATGDDGKINLDAVGLSVTLELAGIVVEHLADAQGEIYAFLGNVSGLSRKQLENLSMADFLQMIVDLVRKREFKDFISVASKLFS